MRRRVSGQRASKTTNTASQRNSASVRSGSSLQQRFSPRSSCSNSSVTGMNPTSMSIVGPAQPSAVSDSMTEIACPWNIKNSMTGIAYPLSVKNSMTDIAHTRSIDSSMTGIADPHSIHNTMTGMVYPCSVVNSGRGLHFDTLPSDIPVTSRQEPVSASVAGVNKLRAVSLSRNTLGMTRPSIVHQRPSRSLVVTHSRRPTHSAFMGSGVSSWSGTTPRIVSKTGMIVTLDSGKRSKVSRKKASVAAATQSSQARRSVKGKSSDVVPTPVAPLGVMSLENEQTKLKPFEPLTEMKPLNSLSPTDTNDRSIFSKWSTRKNEAFSDIFTEQNDFFSDLLGERKETSQTLKSSDIGRSGRGAPDSELFMTTISEMAEKEVTTALPGDDAAFQLSDNDSLVKTIATQQRKARSHQLEEYNAKMNENPSAIEEFEKEGSKTLSLLEMKAVVPNDQFAADELWCQIKPIDEDAVAVDAFMDFEKVRSSSFLNQTAEDRTLHSSVVSSDLIPRKQEVQSPTISDKTGGAASHIESLKPVPLPEIWRDAEKVRVIAEKNSSSKEKETPSSLVDRTASEGTLVPRNEDPPIREQVMQSLMQEIDTENPSMPIESLNPVQHPETQLVARMEIQKTAEKNLESPGKKRCSDLVVWEADREVVIPPREELVFGKQVLRCLTKEAEPEEPTKHVESAEPVQRSIVPCDYKFQSPENKVSASLCLKPDVPSPTALRTAGDDTFLHKFKEAPTWTGFMVQNMVEKRPVSSLDSSMESTASGTAEVPVTAVMGESPCFHKDKVRDSTDIQPSQDNAILVEPQREIPLAGAYTDLILNRGIIDGPLQHEQKEVQSPTIFNKTGGAASHIESLKPVPLPEIRRDAEKVLVIAEKNSSSQAKQTPSSLVDRTAGEGMLIPRNEDPPIKEQVMQSLIQDIDTENPSMHIEPLIPVQRPETQLVAQMEIKKTAEKNLENPGKKRCSDLVVWEADREVVIPPSEELVFGKQVLRCLTKEAEPEEPTKHVESAEPVQRSIVPCDYKFQSPEKEVSTSLSLKPDVPSPTALGTGGDDTFLHKFKEAPTWTGLLVQNVVEKRPVSSLDSSMESTVSGAAEVPVTAVMRESTSFQEDKVRDSTDIQPSQDNAILVEPQREIPMAGTYTDLILNRGIIDSPFQHEKPSTPPESDDASGNKNLNIQKYSEDGMYGRSTAGKSDELRSESSRLPLELTFGEQDLRRLTKEAKPEEPAEHVESAEPVQSYLIPCEYQFQSPEKRKSTSLFLSSNVTSPTAPPTAADDTCAPKIQKTPIWTGMLVQERLEQGHVSSSDTAIESRESSVTNAPVDAGMTESPCVSQDKIRDSTDVLPPQDNASLVETQRKIPLAGAYTDLIINRGIIDGPLQHDLPGTPSESDDSRGNKYLDIQKISENEMYGGSTAGKSDAPHSESSGLPFGLAFGEQGLRHLTTEAEPEEPTKHVESAEPVQPSLIPYNYRLRCPEKKISRSLFLNANASSPTELPTAADDTFLSKIEESWAGIVAQERLEEGPVSSCDSDIELRESSEEEAPVSAAMTQSPCIRTDKIPDSTDVLPPQDNTCLIDTKREILLAGACTDPGINRGGVIESPFEHEPRGTAPELDDASGKGYLNIQKTLNDKVHGGSITGESDAHRSESSELPGTQFGGQAEETESSEPAGVGTSLFAERDTLTDRKSLVGLSTASNSAIYRYGATGATKSELTPVTESSMDTATLEGIQKVSPKVNDVEETSVKPEEIKAEDFSRLHHNLQDDILPAQVHTCPAELVTVSNVAPTEGVKIETTKATVSSAVFERYSLRKGEQEMIEAKLRPERSSRVELDTSNTLSDGDAIVPINESVNREDVTYLPEKQTLMKGTEDVYITHGQQVKETKAPARVTTTIAAEKKPEQLPIKSDAARHEISSKMVSSDAEDSSEERREGPEWERSDESRKKTAGGTSGHLDVEERGTLLAIKRVERRSCDKRSERILVKQQGNFPPEESRTGVHESFFVTESEVQVFGISSEPAKDTERPRYDTDGSSGTLNKYDLPTDLDGKPMTGTSEQSQLEFDALNSTRYAQGSQYSSLKEGSPMCLPFEKTEGSQRSTRLAAQDRKDSHDMAEVDEFVAASNSQFYKIPTWQSATGHTSKPASRMTPSSTEVKSENQTPDFLSKLSPGTKDEVRKNSVESDELRFENFRTTIEQMADLAAKSKTAVAYDSFVPAEGKEDNFLEIVYFNLGYTVRSVDDYDVTAIMYDQWEDNSATVAHTIKTFWMYCPQSFLVCVNEEGAYCGIISAIVFEDEVAFCGFNHVKPCTTGGTRRMLWDAVLAINAGKNVFTLVPAERVNSYHRQLGFHTSSRGLVLHGKLPETTDISHFGTTETMETKVVKFKKSMFHFLVSYDKGIFGFGRRRFWRLTLNEESLHLRVAVNASNRICGYAGLQEDTTGVPVLRWLIANDGETAKQLLFSILADSHAFREHGVWLALYVRSHIASELLKHFDTSRLQPWMLVFNRREPFLHYRNIVVLTYI